MGLFLCALCWGTEAGVAEEKRAVSGPATSHLYVAQEGLGAADGSSSANARPVAFFNDTVNWGDVTAPIHAGTIIHLCGAISTQLTAHSSGSTGAPITVVFERGAKISPPKSDVKNGCLNVSGTQYLIVDGGKDGIIENTDNGTNLRFQVSSMGIKAMSCSHCEFKNLHIINLYIHTSPLDVTDLDGSGAIDFSGSHIQIHDNTIHDVHWALNFVYGNGDTDIDIYNNDISRTDHGFSVGGWGTTVKASGIKFHDNHVHDYANWDTTKNAYHHDGVHAYATPPAAATDLQIYNNLFDGDTGKSLTGHIFIESGTSPWGDENATSRIFNNVLIANSVSYTGILNVGDGTAEVYNNTVISDGSPGTGYGINNLLNAHVKNNLAIHCDTLIAAKNIKGIVDFDHNAYFQPGLYNGFVWNEKVFTPSLALWRASCHAEEGSIYPKVDPGVDLKTGRLKAGSPAIGLGENLTGLGISALNADKDGHPRPKNGPWDAGAYLALQPGPKAAASQSK